jgi:arsenite methyltransferase
MASSEKLESLDPASVAAAVSATYSEGAQAVQEELCCPVNYDAQYLEVLPQEILQRDYGCGDPSRHLRAGETVLDLGSGGGKICYIASQVVGAQGRVIGVDMNTEMLSLARRHQTEVAEKIGWSNVEFRRGRIEDLGLDMDQLGQWMTENPVQTVEGFQALEAETERLRRAQPMVADQSIDVVVSNCVLNLVAPGQKVQMFNELFRVLKVGGRAVISDIVCDRPVPESMQKDPELWAGCISGAFEEAEFLQAFELAGFHGIQVLTRQAEPWKVVEGIDFRSVTVVAYKGNRSYSEESGQSVIYLGPFSEIADDHGNLFSRGVRTEVDQDTYARLGDEPYRENFARLDADGQTSDCCSSSENTRSEGSCCG